jgi:hypothetical protein
MFVSARRGSSSSRRRRASQAVAQRVGVRQVCSTDAGTPFNPHGGTTSSCSHGGVGMNLDAWSPAPRTARSCCGQRTSESCDRALSPTSCSTTQPGRRYWGTHSPAQYSGGWRTRSPVTRCLEFRRRVLPDDRLIGSGRCLGPRSSTPGIRPSLESRGACHNGFLNRASQVRFLPGALLTRRRSGLAAEGRTVAGEMISSADAHDDVGYLDQGSRVVAPCRILAVHRYCQRKEAQACAAAAWPSP